MSKYYVEYGALQANAERLIECDTSALPAKKITEELAVKIADALNRQKAEEGAETTGDSQAIRNSAAMREALVCLRDVARNFYHQILNSKYNDIMDKYTCCKQGFPAVLDLRYAISKANFALSAPARNCDRFADAETARQAWLDDAENWDEFGSPELELHEWLLAPAAERKGEGDE